VFIRKFVPDLRVDSVYDIDLAALRREGVRGIIADLDNTLVGARHPEATPELVEWLENVKAQGFRVVIVSNNGRHRVSAFADPIRLPYVSRARKPGQRPFRKALKLLELTPPETVVVGDQLLTDVFGGNRIGLRTILVTPISPADESVTTRINRRIERFIYRRLKKRGLISWDH